MSIPTAKNPGDGRVEMPSDSGIDFAKAEKSLAESDAKRGRLKGSVDTGAEKRVERMVGDPLLKAKIAAAHELMEYFKKNPKMKIEDLKAADFVKDRELLRAIEKNPAIWKELLDQAGVGHNIRAVVSNPGFDLKDEKTWEPKGVYEHTKDGFKNAGAYVSKMVKEHPVAVAGLMLAGASILLYLKRDVVKGWLKSLGGKLSALLGFSFLGALNPFRLISPEAAKDAKEFLDKVGHDVGSREGEIKASKEALKLAREKGISDPKLLAKLGSLEKAFGAATSIAILYHLHFSKDKKKALVETAAGLASATAGLKIADLVGKNLSPKARMIVDLIGGIGGAMGFAEPLSDLIEKHLKFAGSEQLGVELSQVFEKAGVRSLGKMALKAVPKAMEKQAVRGAVESMSGVMAKKIEASVFRKLGKFIGKEFFEKLALKTGAKAAVTASITPADFSPAAPIVFLIQLGMAAWMAKDGYELYVVINKSLGVHKMLKARNEKAISEIKFLDEPSEKAFSDAMLATGKTPETMTDAERMAMLESIADIHFKLTRDGTDGFEEYHMKKGEVMSIKVSDGSKTVELDEKTLSQDVVFGAPEEFDPAKIDRSLPDEQLFANYQLAIAYMKNEAGWTHLDYEIVDRDTVIIKRLESGQKLTLKADGDEWKIEGISKDLNFAGAVALANFINKVADVLKDKKGESDKPFSVDGERIDFDGNWAIFDTTILNNPGWVEFYKKLGLSTKEITKALNKWYAQRGESSEALAT